MSFEIHFIVRHSPDFHPAIPHPIEQEMTGTVNSPDGFADALSAMPQVIRPRFWSNLGPVVAAGTMGIFGKVHDSPDQECLVSPASLVTKLLMRPPKNGLDVLFRLM